MDTIDSAISKIDDKLVFTIEGSDEISLDTLANTLSGTSKALKQIALKSDVGEDQKFIVNDIKKGSFKIFLKSVKTMGTIILPGVPSALSLLSDILDIKEHLNGDTAKDIVVNEGNNTVTVKNSTDVNLTINNYSFNVYTEDSKIDESITFAMKAIENDPNATGLSLSKGGESNDIQNYDTSKLAKKVDVSKLKKKNKEITEQNIKLTKIDFVGRSMWKGIMLGKEIQFYMTDDLFRENIQNYQFTKGTIINVELVTEYVTKDNDQIDDKTVKYEVKRIKKVINNEDEQLHF